MTSLPSLARLYILAFNSRKTKLRRALLWVAVSTSKPARGRPHVAPNLHYDSASASPLSLHSKEIKYTKRATRANARRRDAPTPPATSPTPAGTPEATNPPLNPLAPSRRSSSTASRCGHTQNQRRPSDRPRRSTHVLGLNTALPLKPSVESQKPISGGSSVSSSHVVHEVKER